MPRQRFPASGQLSPAGKNVAVMLRTSSHRAPKKVTTMPWILQPSKEPYVANPESCPSCAGHPRKNDSQCSDCGAAFICDDPPPREVHILAITPVDQRGDPPPRRHRKDVEIRWGECRQFDGSFAAVCRSINKQFDRYVETTLRPDGSFVSTEEQLSQHRGHGSDRPTART